MRRQYLMSLSLANLVYLRAWADLIPMRSKDLFFRKTVPGFTVYLALVADVLILSLAIYGVLRLAPKMPAWLRRLLPLGALAIVALGAAFLRSHLDFIPSGPRHVLLGLLLAAAAGVTLWSPRRASRLIAGFALSAAPCLAVTFLAPLYYLSGPSALPPDPPLARRLPGVPPVRVVWVVFDDWDQKLTFANSAVLPPVPVLRGFAAESFSATDALAVQSEVPVVNMATQMAVPSLIYGKVVIGEAIADASSQYLWFSDGDHSTALGQGDSVFARFRARGWNSAIAGWYLPYCRTFAAQVTDCYWDVRYDQSSSVGQSAGEAALDETRMLFESEGHSPFGRSLVASRHFAEYQALLAAAGRYVADPSLGLVFLHLNVPHPPSFSEREPGDPYMNDLKWVDRAAAQVLRALNGAGLADRTAVIFTSDHPARLAPRTDPHVPLIVHLPGEQAPVVENQEFSALGLTSLVLAIADGQVRSLQSVDAFLLNRH